MRPLVPMVAAAGIVAATLSIADEIISLTRREDHASLSLIGLTALTAFAYMYLLLRFLRPGLWQTSLLANGVITWGKYAWEPSNFTWFDVARLLVTPLFVLLVQILSESLRAMWTYRG